VISIFIYISGLHRQTKTLIAYDTGSAMSAPVVLSKKGLVFNS
jgi:hypothetical protein